MSDKWAFFFPGQGSQKPGMGKCLYEKYEAARRVFEEADEALAEPLSQLCFEGPEEVLQRTENAQPALLTTSMAACAVVRQEVGIEPRVCLGHSLGEFSALVAAGAFAFDDAVRLVRLRGRAMQEAVPEGEGGMVALLYLGDGPEARLLVDTLAEEAAAGETLRLANQNGGGQYVLSGHAGALDRVLDLAARQGIEARRLRVSAPFHSSLMQPAAENLAAALEEIRVRKPRIPVIRNVDAQMYRDADEIKDHLVKQVTSPVLWRDCVLSAVRLGVTHGLELGSRRVLSDLVRKITQEISLRPITTTRQLEWLAYERYPAPHRVLEPLASVAVS